MTHDSFRPKLVEPPYRCDEHGRSGSTEIARGKPAVSAEMPPISASEAADYIAQLTAELAFVARKSKLDLLAYLLEMARSEALATTKRHRRK